MGLEILAGKVPVIAIMGAKHSGKSEAAKALIGVGFTQFAFADKLKEAAMLIYGLSHEQVYGDLKEVVDPRYGLTPRFILQRLATEVCRSVHPDTWILALEHQIHEWSTGRRYDSYAIVIDDLRFKNEAEYVKLWGGEIWEVERPDSGYSGEHSSEERVLVTPDRILNNNADRLYLKRITLTAWKADCGRWSVAEQYLRTQGLETGNPGRMEG